MRGLNRTILSIVAGISFLLGPCLTSASAATLVPFHGQYSASQTLYPDGTGVLSGTGVGTDLGKTSLNGSLTIVGPATCPGGFLVHHRFTFTGADGDSLLVTIDNAACPAGPGTLQGS
ncbi:MAG TPA: hypothetical protein VFZ25_09180, partial [Chloroflexota bacterium]|nr:hypothetical protein [Chloroflexota bacterium]